MSTGTALLGSSPLMLILADHLGGNGPVTVFEERRTLGGAWSQVELAGERLSGKTNIVVPLDAGEEEVVPRINRLLARRFGVVAVPSSDSISMLSGYQPQARYHYDFRPLLLRPRRADLVHERVAEVAVRGRDVIVNGRVFSAMYLPCFGGIGAIDVDGRVHETPFTEITSEHLLAVFEGAAPAGALYAEAFSDVFDRVQVRLRPGGFVFTGRVGRPHKGRPLAELSGEASAIFGPARLRHALIDHYRNAYRDAEQLAQLRRAVAAAPPLRLVDTAQFVSGFRSLMPLLAAEGVDA